MQKEEWLNLMRQLRAIAVVRCDHLEIGYRMAHAVAQGGMRLIEVTWNSDRPAELIRSLRTTLPSCYIGAGTLLTLDHVEHAIAAGAQFLFTPHVGLDLIRHAAVQQVPLVAGALSPTEIVTAWQAGASGVKVFPVQAMGGANYLRNLQGPLGEIPLVPTGGVTIQNAHEFLQAGAIAVGLAGDLFPRQAVQQRNWEAITQQSQLLVQHLELRPPLRSR